MASNESSSAGKKKPMDLINRGAKYSTPLGTSLFVGLRSLDPIFQYGILAHGVGSSLLHKIGLETLPAGLPTATGTFIDALGLSPYRLVLLSMAVGSSAKQIYWLLGLSQEAFHPSAAVPVSIYNTLVNSLNTLIFTTAIASGSTYNGGKFPQVPFVIGSLMYVVGISVETIAEIQRKNFKSKPENKGKCYTGGLWAYARHVNYAGYAVWRTGFAMAAGGYPWALAFAAWQSFDFTQRSIPILDEYCGERYGEQWAEFKKKTPYKYFPGIY
ncbi:hypothetical protein K402DRAFT_425461 [Aulographum hederae CBS 113979]|uniref:Steroid 5-alpha reductase C-terminal domain-containing protein n=1 Tax=Aulographum hederae CBS 113979 TaxID=1176131 RepID=A0A6G1GKG7_9PEZI|nr:hypothetical protein K402DRAFT_425461 [Aulographum hederae CBS 113979]